MDVPFSLPHDNGAHLSFNTLLRRGAEINYLVVPSLWIDEYADKFYFDLKNQKWFFQEPRTTQIHKVRMLDYMLSCCECDIDFMFFS